MYNHYPWLRLCDGHWKAKLIGVTKYRHWKRDRAPKVIKQEHNGASPATKRKNKSSTDAPGAKRPRVDESPSGSGPASPSNQPAQDSSFTTPYSILDAPSSPQPSVSLPSAPFPFAFAPPVISAPPCRLGEDAVHPCPEGRAGGGADKAAPSPSVDHHTMSTPPHSHTHNPADAPEVTSTAVYSGINIAPTPKPHYQVCSPIAF